MKRAVMKHRAWRTIWLLTCLLLCGVVHADKVTYIYTAPDGTVIAEADEQGNVTKTFDYRPYGEQALGQPPNGPGYTGQVNDPDTGLVYIQARYYDPELGRFLSVDPVGPKPGDVFGFNRYAYAHNNPVANIDPNGREAACVSMASHCGGVANNLPVDDIAELGRELIEPLGVEQPELRLGEEIVAAEDATSAVQAEEEVARAIIPDSEALSGTETAGSIRNVNPNYPASGYNQNCVNCVVATDATLKGNRAMALPSDGPVAISVLEKQYGNTFGPASTIEGIASQMSDAGDGANGIIFGSRGPGEAGHVFNVVNQQGTIRFLDGQTGSTAVTDGYSSFYLLRTN
jgi:RHS repeat-associated protein